MISVSPQDQASRYAAENSLDQTTFISAGAGTGKTTTIVKRIVNAVCSQGDSLLMKNLAAVTFTERAAAELRRRIREALQAEADKGNANASAALFDFDSAQIGTIHAFAKRILSSFPIEAGLPLAFEVMDEASSKLSLRDTASGLVGDFFDGLNEEQHSLMLMAGISPVLLREFVLELNAKRLLVNEEDIKSRRQHDPNSLVREFMEQLTSWFESQRPVWQGCTASLSAKIESALNELTSIYGEPNELNPQQIARLQKALNGLVTPGNAGGSAAKPFRDEMKELFAGGLDGLELIDVENFLRRELPSIWQALLESMKRRVELGRLTFDDLIVLTVQVIEEHPDVRSMLHRDFKLVVVDEFQDTDPVQWKLVSLITTPVGEAAPNQGSLVLVGDAQQSIYSFRGADVATYLNVTDQVGVSPLGGIKETLSVNFRSNQKILSWVNAVFSHESIELGTEFVNLYTADKNLVNDDHLPGVAVLGGPDAGIAHEDESAYIASAVFQTVAQAWPVFDKGLATYRPARYSDTVVLIPARTSLEDLLDELSIRGIPYRSSDSAIVFDRPAVRGLIAAMKVVAGVEQPLDLWFALKSPLFGCDDFELLEYKRLGGKWTLPFGEESAHLVSNRVYQSLSRLGKIRRTSSSLSPAAVMMQILEECRVISTYDRTPRGRFEIECLQMVMRQARSWSQAGGAGVNDYLSWLKDQLSENARENLPETDDLGDDAVRISTVHGVKGLEFPIVILAGMSRRRRAVLPMISVKLNRFEFKVGDLKSHGYIHYSAKAELSDRSAEQARVLYVAATRARDHLLVSNLANLNLDGGTQSWSGLYMTAVEATLQSGLASRFDQFVGPDPEPQATVQPNFTPETPEWLAQVPEIRAKSKIKTLVTPSALGAAVSPGALLDEVILLDDSQQESKTYQESDFGGADVAKLGNAFHRVMEVAIERRLTEIDESLSATMHTAIEEYGVAKHSERLAEMVSAIFGHGIMERIYSADKAMPELAISEVNQEGVLVEGFADLVLQERGSLVVIDYKTNLELTQNKIEIYAKQIEAYAQIIQRATGLEVVEKLLVHVLPEKIDLINV